MDGQFDRFATTDGLVGDGSASLSDEHLFPCRRSMIRIGHARFQVVHVEDAIVPAKPTPCAPVKRKRTLKCSLPAPVTLASTEDEPVDMDWDPAPPCPVRLNRKRRLEEEDVAAAASS